MADLEERLTAAACRACDTPHACSVVRPRPCDAGGGAHLAADDLAVDADALRALARAISEQPPSL